MDTRTIVQENENTNLSLTPSIAETDQVAFCFIIAGYNKLNKEHIWKKWIETNSDIINPYFYYKHKGKNDIKSDWIRQYCINDIFIKPATYFYMSHTYFTLMSVALQNPNNKWFIFLTEACCPIISTGKFRRMFMKLKNTSFMSNCPAHWNIQLVNRANLKHLDKKYHLKNTPYPIFNRFHAELCIRFTKEQKNAFITICNGMLSNESIFSIIMKYYNELENVANENTTITDWIHPASSTSPHLFKFGTREEIAFIDETFLNDPNSMFIRKIDATFPDEIINWYILKK